MKKIIRFGNCLGIKMKSGMNSFDFLAAVSSYRKPLNHDHSLPSLLWCQATFPWPLLFLEGKFFSSVLNYGVLAHIP